MDGRFLAAGLVLFGTVVVAGGKTLIEFIPDAIRLLTRESPVILSDVIPNPKPVPIPDREKPFFRKLKESPEFVKLSKSALSACERSMWRSKVRAELKNYNDLTKDLNSQRTDSAIKSFVAEKVKDIATIELVSVGLVKIETNISDGKLSLVVHTPCGAHQYTRPLTLDGQHDVIAHPYTDADKISITKHLLIGQWLFKKELPTSVGRSTYLCESHYKAWGGLSSECYVQIYEGTNEKHSIAFEVSGHGRWILDENEQLILREELTRFAEFRSVFGKSKAQSIEKDLRRKLLGKLNDEKLKIIGLDERNVLFENIDTANIQVGVKFRQ